jgi:preflagellin peptidase FlaK
MIDIIASIASMIFFSYATYCDIKSRRVSNWVWILMVLVSAPLLFFRLDVYNVVSICFMSLFALLLYYMGRFLLRFGLQHGLYGGADAKAIIALSFMMPEWPFGSGYPIFFSLSVLLIASIAAASVPLGILFYNLSRGNREMPEAFLAIEKIEFDEKKYWIYRKKEDSFLVTPKIPFILFLLIGLIISLILSL